MKPFVVHAGDAEVEVWSGSRIQFGGDELPAWQKLPKAELKDALSCLTIPGGAPFAGYYDTGDPRMADTENSLFTNVSESMPGGLTSLHFERGVADPPAPPVPIELINGHLHYYRYGVGGQWARWGPDQTVARWDRIPRRLPDDGSAGPAWFALREANAAGLVSTLGNGLGPSENFGIRLTVHATQRRPAQSDCVQRTADRWRDRSVS